MSELFNGHLLSVVTFLPAIGALLILGLRALARDDEASGLISPARQAGLFITLVTFILSLFLLIGFDRDQSSGFQFEEVFAWTGAIGPVDGIAYRIGIDGISLPFILLTTALFPICILASLTSIKERVIEYIAAFLILETLLIGVFASLDLFLFYIFFEAGLIPMFLIIGIWGGKNRIYAAFKFFLYTLLGSLFMLAAMAVMAWQAGTTDIRALLVFEFDPAFQIWFWLAFFASFAVKMPMWPVHTWLPDAHVQAPTSGSVILAGILLKLGGYGFLRFSLPMFPQANEIFAPLVFVLSAIAIIYASLVAFRQTDMKKLIAYSSVAHMGFVTIGLFAGTEQGVQGAIFQMISHGFISAALFLCVGVVYDRTHRRDIAFFGGLARIMPIFAVFFLFFTMGNVGLPGTSGFVGEFLTLISAFQVSSWLAFFTALGMIVSALYALTLYRRVMYEESPAALQALTLTDLDHREKINLGLLAFGALILGVQPGLLTSLTENSVQHLLSLMQ